MDKLQSIRFFLKLSETLSFKATADYFRVPSSTVSRSIKNLETSLGTSLLERTTRQVRLTEAGAWYKAEVSGPLRTLAAADEMAEAQAREPTGIVRITALPGYGEIRLFPVLERFRAQYPRIVCDVEMSDRYLDLSSGEIDVALRATDEPPDYLVAKKLHSHRFVMVASPEYLNKYGRPQKVADMTNQVALAYRGPHGIVPWMATRSNGELLTVPRKLGLISNNGMYLLQNTLEGKGVSFLPSWGVSQELSSGQLEEIRLEDAIFATVSAHSHLYMLYHPEKARLGKVRALVDFLAEALSDT